MGSAVAEGLLSSAGESVRQSSVERGVMQQYYGDGGCFEASECSLARQL